MHVVAMRELCRVATEVRIFPLVTLDAEPSPFADICAGDLRAAGFDVDIERVDYEFQRGGNRMMRVRRSGPRERHAVGSTCV
jgi:hypothetical protein